MSCFSSLGVRVRGRSSARIRESIRAKIRVKMLWRESRWIQVDSRKTSYQTVKLSVKMIISFVQKDRKFHRVNSLFCFYFGRFPIQYYYLLVVRDFNTFVRTWDCSRDVFFVFNLSMRRDRPILHRPIIVLALYILNVHFREMKSRSQRCLKMNKNITQNIRQNVVKLDTFS